MVIIKGIQKTSMIDYPGKISTVIFTGKCNMKCPFCQNPDLIINTDKMPELDEKKILGFLKKKKKWIDGVCITGGEPLIHKDIGDFIKKIKELGFLVKIDTNGLNPELLKKLIDDKIIDYIAMDIKSDKEHYSRATGTEVDIEKIDKSIELIKSSGISYEFRATIVPDFFDQKIMQNIGEWLKGSKRFALQQFRSTLPLLDKAFEGKEPYKKEVLDQFRDIMQGYVEEVELRV
ncbi:anaerobic ribonucleoside-triphosphate reductase activating protein [Candidatus Woesearchaeota archaeon]|nr:anaerobic ribonucleoside-triphosphate reductase activating protein [Candidatus Woesearchaeota archaeon]